MLKGPPVWSIVPSLSRSPVRATPPAMVRVAPAWLVSVPPELTADGAAGPLEEIAGEIQGGAGGADGDVLAHTDGAGTGTREGAGDRPVPHHPAALREAQVDQAPWAASNVLVPS